jgi:hypothetical protein
VHEQPLEKVSIVLINIESSGMLRLDDVERLSSGGAGGETQPAL